MNKENAQVETDVFQAAAEGVQPAGDFKSKEHTQLNGEQVHIHEEAVRIDEQGRDILDGGFAVVDREKIIEEETREITPWYMHFINVFVAPRKMMEENFYHEPPKGMSIGIVGCILFTVLCTILTYLNPMMKDQMYEKFRMQGIAEEMISQKYIMTVIPIIIGAIIGIFFGALLTAVTIQIVKAIVKDKASFKLLYIIALLSTMVSSALMCVDRLIGLLIPTTTVVLGLPILFSEEALAASPVLMTVANTLTLPSILSLVILIIGYAVAARASIKKSTVIIIGVQIFWTLVSIGLVSLGQMAMQMQAGAGM